MANWCSERAIKTGLRPTVKHPRRRGGAVSFRSISVACFFNGGSESKFSVAYAYSCTVQAKISSLHHPFHIEQVFRPEFLRNEKGSPLFQWTEKWQDWFHKMASTTLLSLTFEKAVYQLVNLYFDIHMLLWISLLKYHLANGSMSDTLTSLWCMHTLVFAIIMDS